MTLDLLAWSPRVSVARDHRDRPSIEERFRAFHAANPHVLDELLRLACVRLNRGETFVSVKALWEECRASMAARKEGGFKLNNDFTSEAARWLLRVEPRLEGVIRTRRLKR